MTGCDWPAICTDPEAEFYDSMFCARWRFRFAFNQVILSLFDAVGVPIILGTLTAYSTRLFRWLISG